VWRIAASVVPAGSKMSCLGVLVPSKERGTGGLRVYKKSPVINFTFFSPHILWAGMGPEVACSGLLDSLLRGWCKFKPKAFHPAL
jgi:hypothetical protein